MVIRVYWASVTGNRKVNAEQTRLRNVLESLKLDSIWIDITTSSAVRTQMREQCSNPKALPPQIFNEEIYLGNMEEMEGSIEEGRLKEWLKLKEVTNSEENCAAEDPTKIDPNGESPVKSEETVTHYVAPNEPITQEVEKTEVVVVGKSVSSAVNTFENLNKSPKVSRKTVQLRFQNNNNNNSNSDKTCAKIDEERRRRILGLPPTDQNESQPMNCLQDKTNDIVPLQNGVMTAADTADVKTFAGVKRMKELYSK